MGLVNKNETMKKDNEIAVDEIHTLKCEVESLTLYLKAKRENGKEDESMAQVEVVRLSEENAELRSRCNSWEEERKVVSLEVITLKHEVESFALSMTEKEEVSRKMAR